MLLGTLMAIVFGTANGMARHLLAEFGERVEPAEERLARFVRSMLRSRMIEV